MELLATLVDYLAAPPRLFTLALLLFLASRGSKLAFSRGGGAALAAAAALLAVAGLGDPGCRRLILHPERLPVVILVLSSVAVLWTEMRRLRLAGGGPEARPLPAARVGFSTADAVAATAAGLALVACVLLLPPGLGAEADPAAGPGPEAAIKAPWFFVGLQELDLYFDPWVPYLALPLLLLGGLFGLPCLRPPGGGPTWQSPGGGPTWQSPGGGPTWQSPGGGPTWQSPGGGPTWQSPGGGFSGGGRRRSLFLFGWLLLWLWPMTVGALLRGAHWRAFGPFEAWDPAVSAASPARPLSEVFWLDWLRSFEPASWWLRELPGVLLIAAYFGLLPVALQRLKTTRGAFATYRKTMGTWRFRAALAWVLALTVVPLKMYGWWLLGIGYWIHLPELSIRF